MNGLDLFSGIGGLSLALGPWVRTVAYCEIDRYCQGVLLSRMQHGELGKAPIWDDVRTLKKELLPKIEIIYGGFPCQDISVAGPGAGLAGERSGLFWELHRLVRECAPSFVFLENVAAIRTRGLDVVVRALSELGYECRWTIVSAQEVGATHLRRRWFMLASNTNGETLRIEQGRWRGENGLSPPLNPPDGDSWSIEKSFDWTSEQRIFGAGNGIPFAVDRDRCLGNAVVPLQARIAFQRLAGIREGGVA